MTQETGRERYYRQIREIRDELGVSHDEARQRWSDYYAPGGDPIKPVKRLTLAIRASTTNQRTCPFCRDSIYHPDEGGPDYVCASCQAHYHLDCFEDELEGRCATLGCATRRVIGRVGTQIRARGRGIPTQLEAGRRRMAERAQEPSESPQTTQEPVRLPAPSASQESLLERLQEHWAVFAQSCRDSVPELVLIAVVVLIALAISVLAAIWMTS